MANKINIVITAEDKASKPLQGVNKELDETGKAAGRFNRLYAAAAKTALISGTVAFTALATGAVSATKASFDQVNAVENARFGLQAYEKDASKVNKVLGGLIDYAKSDTGVLFNRRDLFDAASTLKMYGDATDDITGHVKILSKGVAQGKTTFQDLSSIVGRAAAKGRLDAVDFDMLIERGIGLDKKFRGATVSSEELYEALNNAIPDATLKGRADTIDGKMVRLQSAFRGVGDEILGVDGKTSTFIKGGLGDRFMQAVSGATDLLKKLAPFAGDVATYFLNLSDSAVELGKQVGDYLNPKFQTLWETISTKLWPSLQKFWKEVVEPFIPVIGEAFVGALGFLIDSLGFALDAISPFISFLADNDWIVWGFVDAILAVKTALALEAAFSAATAVFSTFTNATIPAAITKFGVFKTLVTTAIPMPALAIGAALGSLALVVEAVNAVHRSVDALNFAAAQAKADAEAARQLRDVANAKYKAGQIDVDEYNYLMQVANGHTDAQRKRSNQGVWVSGYASGTNSAPGGWSIVGEHGPELRKLGQGDQVIPAYRSRSAGVPSGGGVNIESLTYHVYNQMDEKRALRDLGFALELAA